MLTWAHHYGAGTGSPDADADADETGSGSANGSADAAMAGIAAAPLKKPHLLRHLVSTQIRSGWPRKQLLGTRPEHSEQLLRILHYVSKRTSATPARGYSSRPLRPPSQPPRSTRAHPHWCPTFCKAHTDPDPTAFTKSGDLVIHATLYADLPAERIASLSLYELPYELAGHQYGVKANQKARPRTPAAAAESPQPGLHPGGLRVSGPTARRPPTAADRQPPTAGPAHL